MAEGPSSWSKKVGKTVGEMLTETFTTKELAEKAGISPAMLKGYVDGTKEWPLGDLVAVSNAVDYTPGGLLNKALKKEKAKAAA